MRTYKITEGYDIPEVHNYLYLSRETVKIYEFLDDYDKKTIYKIPHKQFITILSRIRDTLLNNDNLRAILFINLLIGNKKLYNKIFFCRDIRYLKNTIFIYSDSIKIGEYNEEHIWNYKYAEELDKDDMYNFFNKYKVIFIFIADETDN